MPSSRLPRIMVAPNGARRTSADHPAIPVTIEQVAATAAACFAAGAGGIHAHVRDAAQKHVLDAGLYRELLAEIAQKAPGMLVQITSEAVGLYSPAEQRALVRDVMPAEVSIALREMTPGEAEADLRQFYHWMQDAGIGVQHILYAPEDYLSLIDHIDRGIIPEADLELLFVLGRYSDGQQSTPADLDPFLAAAGDRLNSFGWAVCAFGSEETDCLVRAAGLGGKARIGFENNLYNRDGQVAADNAERVAELVAALAESARA